MAQNKKKMLHALMKEFLFLFFNFESAFFLLSYLFNGVCDLFDIVLFIPVGVLEMKRRY